WDAQGKLARSVGAHAKGIAHLAFRPDGKRLATASLDGTCKLWDTSTWKEIKSLTAQGTTLEAIAWSRDGTLVAAGDDEAVYLWNASSYEILHTLNTPGKGLIDFTPDGRTLLTGRFDCRPDDPHAFTRWDVPSGKRQATFTLPSPGHLNFFHLSLDGKTV